MTDAKELDLKSVVLNNHSFLKSSSPNKATGETTKVEKSPITGFDSINGNLMLQSQNTGTISNEESLYSCSSKFSKKSGKDSKKHKNHTLKKILKKLHQ